MDLVEAIDSGDENKAIKLIIAHQDDISYLEYDNNLPLLSSVIAGMYKVASYLLLNGVDPNIDGNAIISHAIVNERGEIIKLLVSYNFDIHRDHEFPLSLAITEKHAHIVQDIVDMGADVSVVFESGVTSLEQAADQNDLEIVQVLVTAGAEITNNVLFIAFESASKTGNADALKFLLRTRYQTRAYLFPAVVRDFVESYAYHDLEKLLQLIQGERYYNLFANEIATKSSPPPPYEPTPPPSSVFKETCEYSASKTDKLGSGTYGVVYKAKYKSETVAVKTTTEIAGADVAEIAALKRISHPHVMNIIHIMAQDECVSGSTLGVVMPLATFVLSTVIQHNIKFSKQAYLDVMWQLSDALEFVHSCNILHLDIKPDNILMKGDVKRPHALLADFGLAMFVKNVTQKTESLNLRITASHRPPEIVPVGRYLKSRRTDMSIPRNEKLFYYDGKSDVYGLGMVFLQTATSAWFQGAAFPVSSNPLSEHFLDIHQNDDWKSFVESTYGSGVVSIIDKMIERNHDSRITMSDVISNPLWQGYGRAPGRMLELSDTPINTAMPDVPFYSNTSLATYAHFLDLYYLLIPYITHSNDTIIFSHPNSNPATDTFDAFVDTLYFITTKFADETHFEQLPPHRTFLMPILKALDGMLYRTTLAEISNNIADMLALYNIYSKSSSEYSKNRTQTPVVGKSKEALRIKKYEESAKDDADRILNTYYQEKTLKNLQDINKLLK